MAVGQPLTLPLLLRDRLVRLILDALHDPDARDTLGRLAGAGAAATDWAAEPEQVEAIRARVRAASTALAARPPGGRAGGGLAEGLADAALLFDAGLFFEVHELLEPHWMAAAGPEREALQGLIQVAVGYQHLANGNPRGARALLGEGSQKLGSRRLAGIDLASFARGAGATPAAIEAGDFGWMLVPPFPRAAD